MSDSPQDQSLLKRWRAGDEAAAQELFSRYVNRLVALAKRRISQRFSSRIDAEDVVQSAFRTFFTRAREDRFDLEDPDDVCKLLSRITVHKTLRQLAFHQAAKRDLTSEMGQGLESEAQLMAVMDREPTPEAANMFLDQLEHFLSQLRDQERRILEMRMEGYQTQEIAKKLNVSDRKIRRLMERVRALAEQEGFTPPGGLRATTAEGDAPRAEPGG